MSKRLYNENYEAMKKEYMQGWKSCFVLITPIRQQPKPAMLVLETGYMWNNPGHVEKVGAALRACGKGSSYLIRSTAPTTENDPNLPSMPQYLAVELAEPVAFYAVKCGRETEATGENACIGTVREFSVEEIRRIVNESRERLHKRHSACGERSILLGKRSDTGALRKPMGARGRA